MKRVKIGLLGLGNIGKGTYEILSKNKEKISKGTNCQIDITKILVSDTTKKRDFLVPQEILTQNVQDILNDPDIDIIVELIGGIDHAFAYMKKALENKKHVVTANKAVIATHGQELFDIALKNNVQILYEASVAGGIPIINALSKPLCGNEFEEILGIVNGTTNYILTQMSEFGYEYDDVLKIAQDLGFAEADPTSDVEGEDAAYKLSILISTAFGVYVDPQNIPREGITKVSKDDIAYASEFGYKIKLLASAKKIGNQVEYHVYPTLVSATHPLASVNNEFNALFIRGDAISDMMFYGKGAGALPTGSAVVGDIVEITKGILNNVPSSVSKADDHSPLELTGEGKSMYYVNFSLTDHPGVLGKVSTAFGNHNISIASVMQRSRGANHVPVVYILHETEKAQLDAALEEIEAYQFIQEVKSILRVYS